MKPTYFLSAMLAGAMLSGSWTSALAEDCVAIGTVESVREVQIGAAAAGPTEVFEHAVRPDTSDELVVRLKDGRAVSVVPDPMQLFRPGQHVVVIRRGANVRIEPS
jgi:outer membrane lipoprotein SlyB